ncbi:MAG TPA: cysteine--tRNA ligase [Thermomicrobiales bacterium]|nr:cysteine--tRNA ligase [Thermomicrobiales bacterium]
MRLYNSQTRSTDEFVVNDGHVGIYVCGVTPYDTTHIGHAFTFLTFDILVRLLRHQGHRVTYVQNVTDIDDDILRKAGEVGLAWDELGRRETEKFLRDMKGLNAVEFDHYTAATQHIPEMLAIVERLVEGGFAYVSNGSIYFEVAKDPEFGKLSHLPIAEMLPIANERGNKPDDPNKRDPLDFILWQAASPGEPTWDSPWGPGRPGWHIECTAMATKYLGKTLDIHGGGYDLIFPHHECEIAQAENATGIEPYVRTWMHVAMVNYEGEKMSKSLGNLVLASDLLKRYPSDAIRLYLFSHHYRAVWEFDDREMQDWAQKTARVHEAARRASGSEDAGIDVDTYRTAYYDALENDLHTPAAIGTLIALADAIHAAPEGADVAHAQETLRETGDILGLTFNGVGS